MKSLKFVGLLTILFFQNICLRPSLAFEHIKHLGTVFSEDQRYLSPIVGYVLGKESYLDFIYDSRREARDRINLEAEKREIAEKNKRLSMLREYLKSRSDGKEKSEFEIPKKESGKIIQDSSENLTEEDQRRFNENKEKREATLNSFKELQRDIGQAEKKLIFETNHLYELAHSLFHRDGAGPLKPGTKTIHALVFQLNGLDPSSKTEKEKMDSLSRLYEGSKENLELAFKIGLIVKEIDKQQKDFDRRQKGQAKIEIFLDRLFQKKSGVKQGLAQQLKSSVRNCLLKEYLGIYPKHITIGMFISLLWMVVERKSEFGGYFAALDSSLQIMPTFFNDNYKKEDCTKISSFRLGEDEDVRSRVEDPYFDIEKCALTAYGASELFSPWSPIVTCIRDAVYIDSSGNFAARNGKEHLFGDCVETSFRNFFSIVLYNICDRDFSRDALIKIFGKELVEEVIEKGETTGWKINIKDDPKVRFLMFYLDPNRMAVLRTKDSHNEWMRVISGLDFSDLPEEIVKEFKLDERSRTVPLHGSVEFANRGYVHEVKTDEGREFYELCSIPHIGFVDHVCIKLTGKNLNDFVAEVNSAYSNSDINFTEIERCKKACKSKLQIKIKKPNFCNNYEASWEINYDQHADLISPNADSFEPVFAFRFLNEDSFGFIKDAIALVKEDKMYYESFNQHFEEIRDIKLKNALHFTLAKFPVSRFRRDLTLKHLKNPVDFNFKIYLNDCFDWVLDFLGSVSLYEHVHVLELASSAMHNFFNSCGKFISENKHGAIISPFAVIFWEFEKLIRSLYEKKPLSFLQREMIEKMYGFLKTYQNDLLVWVEADFEENKGGNDLTVGSILKNAMAINRLFSSKDSFKWIRDNRDKTYFKFINCIPDRNPLYPYNTAPKPKIRRYESLHGRWDWDSCVKPEEDPFEGTSTCTKPVVSDFFFSLPNAKKDLALVSKQKVERLDPGLSEKEMDIYWKIKDIETVTKYALQKLNLNRVSFLETKNES